VIHPARFIFRWGFHSDIFSRKTAREQRPESALVRGITVVRRSKARSTMSLTAGTECAYPSDCRMTSPILSQRLKGPDVRLILAAVIAVCLAVGSLFAGETPALPGE